MNQVKPTALAVIGGGALLLISSFLSWYELSFFGFSGGSANLWDFGLSGFFMLVLSALVIAVPVIDNFAPQISLPDSLIGFTRQQVITVLAFAALVLSLSVLFRGHSAKIGTILALIGSIAALVGSHLESQGAPAASAPPTSI